MAGSAGSADGFQAAKAAGAAIIRFRQLAIAARAITAEKPARRHFDSQVAMWTGDFLFKQWLFGVIHI